MKLTVATIAAAAVWIASSANAYADDLDYPVTRITDKVYAIYGPLDLPTEQNRGFRNTVVIVRTHKGVVVLDPGGSATVGEFVAHKVKALTGDPVVAVFNSHAHGDHWLGNEGIKRVWPDAVIYGHPNMKTRVEGPDGQIWLNTLNRVTNGLADGRRVVPIDRTVTNGDVVTIGDTQFRIHHIGKAHTDNDIMVEIVDQGVLFTGDVVRNGMLGLMEDDASFKGNIAAIDYILKKRFKYYIPGHGKAGGADVPGNYRAYLDAVYKSVQALYQQGLADYEMKPKVLSRASNFKTWSGFDIRVGPHISRAYLEVEAEAF